MQRIDSDAFTVLLNLEIPKTVLCSGTACPASGMASVSPLGQMVCRFGVQCIVLPVSPTACGERFAFVSYVLADRLEGILAQGGVEGLGCSYLLFCVP